MASSNESGHVAVPPHQTTGGDGGLSQAQFGAFQVLQLWMGRSLLTAQHGTAWLQAAQRQASQATTTWLDSLAMGMLEAQQARGLDELMAVPAHLLNRQLDSGFRHLNENLMYLLESEIQWLHDWRDDTLAAARTVATARFA